VYRARVALIIVFSFADCQLRDTFGGGKIRDPEDGQTVDPKSLHKYLYAGGDPVNAKDPSGRAELFETSLVEGGSLVRTVAYARRIGPLSRCILGVEILGLRAFNGTLKPDVLTIVVTASLVTGCLSAAFPNLPF
jgi:hypothetical protein